MAFSKSEEASPDARAFLDRVLAAPKGSKITFGKLDQGWKACPTCGAANVNRNAAWSFRQRCFNLRSRDRAINSRVYQPGDPLYGRSQYDTITLQIFDEPDGRCSIIGVTGLESIEQYTEVQDL